MKLNFRKFKKSIFHEIKAFLRKPTVLCAYWLIRTTWRRALFIKIKKIRLIKKVRIIITNLVISKFQKYKNEIN